MASGSDEMAQPWARQSLVQLAPVWGRITDPQTVQTTTSVQSEQDFPQCKNRPLLLSDTFRSFMRS